MLRNYKFINTVIPLLLIFLMTACFFFVSDSLLMFDRDSIANGEYWRLITNIFTHSNLNHLLLNCASVILIWTLYSKEIKIKLSLTIIAYTTSFVSINIWFFSPLDLYVGFSGALYGIFVIASYIGYKHGDKLSLYLMLLIIGRVLYQQLNGTPEELENLIEMSVAIDSHLYGIISGLLWIFFDFIIRNNKKAN